MCYLGGPGGTCLKAHGQVSDPFLRSHGSPSAVVAQRKRVAHVLGSDYMLLGESKWQ